MLFSVLKMYENQTFKIYIHLILGHFDGCYMTFYILINSYQFFLLIIMFFYNTYMRILMYIYIYSMYTNSFSIL